ncbi:MAG: putative bifunctional diguanylate cyclase/phosphodiesterase [Phycisphaerales bacterium]
MNRRILIIDDNEAIHADFRKILCVTRESAELADAESKLFGAAATRKHVPVDYDLASALQGQAGVDMVKKAVEENRPYALAFVDMRMPPGIDGVETVERLWKVDPNVQVVICTAYSDYSWEELVDRLGQSDQLLFLRKPFDNAEVCLMAGGLTSKWNLARQARMRMAELEVLAEERTAKLSLEIAERRAAEERLRHMAMHDSLTGLHNRPYLVEHLRKCLERQRREPTYLFALLFMDLDNFKLINDSLGHDTGDEALVSTARRVLDALRSTDTLVHANTDTTARVGGDEFIVLLDGVARPSDAMVIAERIQQRLAPPFELRGHSVRLSASIGIAVVDRAYERPEDILRDADAAMYRAKGLGKAQYSMFDDRLHAEALARLKLENDLRKAVDEHEFRLVYEPIVTTDTAGLIGFEALIRWQHPERGLVKPGDFIPAAEEMGLIVPMGHWVIREACRQLRAWTDANPHQKRLSISVNLSKRQVTEPGLCEFVETTLKETGLEGERLNLEVTETAIMARMEPVAEVLRRLKLLGVKIHMDDFGTGLSSLSCLHQFPIDVLKIDRSFIMNMTGRPQLAALVNAVLTLASNLNITVIAEGVETIEQLTQLRALGCQYIQGYHVSESLDAVAAGAMIAEGPRFRAAAA